VRVAPSVDRLGVAQGEQVRPAGGVPGGERVEVRVER